MIYELSGRREEGERGCLYFAQAVNEVQRALPCVAGRSRGGKGSKEALVFSPFPPLRTPAAQAYRACDWLFFPTLLNTGVLQGYWAGNWKQKGPRVHFSQAQHLFLSYVHTSNFYVTICGKYFDRVDSTTIVVDNLQLSESAVRWDSRDKAETRQGCLLVLQWCSPRGRNLSSTWPFFLHLTTFICDNIKS